MIRRTITRLFNDKEIGKRGYVVSKSEWSNYCKNIIKPYTSAESLQFEHKSRYIYNYATIKKNEPELDSKSEIVRLKSKVQYLKNELSLKTKELNSIKLELERDTTSKIQNSKCINKCNKQ
jgi:hypothetical protein